MSRQELLARVIAAAPEFWLGDVVYHVTGEGCRGIITSCRFDGAWMFLVSWDPTLQGWHYGRELSTEENWSQPSPN